ncbi:MAG: prolyl-tRNA synthetase associated domain-containing protein [Alphaproteobacteria bacterium]|nr:prolyl-tRNA synthetase associated domain-containing protein [Alphaproteobacteria bacterium]
MPKSPEDLLDILKSLDVAATTFDHEPVMTVEESRRLRGLIPGLHAKNLFLKDKKGQLWLVTAEEDRVVDLKRLRRQLDAATLSFAKADVLWDALGVRPGSVTPFAVVNDADGRVRVALDRALAEAGRASFHPLDNARTTTVSGADLLRFLEAHGHAPVIVTFSELGGDAEPSTP